MAQIDLFKNRLYLIGIKVKSVTLVERDPQGSLFNSYYTEV